METVIERLGMYEIAWLPVVDAAARTWNDLVSHRLLAEDVSHLLRRELSRVEAGIESTELAAESSSAVSRGTGSFL